MLIDTISLELFSHTDHWLENGQFVLHDRFFMLRNFSFASKDFLSRNQPYRLQEGRVVMVKKGQADYSFNLVDYHFEVDDLVVFLTDTLIEKHYHSDDFEVNAMSFDYDGAWLPADVSRGFIHLHLDDYTRPIVMQHFEMVWSMAHEPQFPLDNIQALLNSFLLFIGRYARLQPALRLSRSEETLRRFVALVSQHAARHRNIPFYADHLCIAAHYLSTLVKQTSGRTVMQWINLTAVKEVKVWLAYSDETIAQIADRMQFPCAASLTKFFRRETGLTPMQYRLSSTRRKV